MVITEEAALGSSLGDLGPGEKRGMKRLFWILSSEVI